MISYRTEPLRGMETVQIGTLEEGVPVFLDKYAYEADHVAIVGRIKPHTDYYAEVESGLHKMMAIGLGKQRGASLYHPAFVRFGYDHILRSVGQMVIDKIR